MKKWRFWIDRGGTFTDIIALSPDNRLHIDKRPASDGDGGLAAARRLLQLPPQALLPASLVDEIRIGTTIATNTLLQRTGDNTAIAVTRGFADALHIGDQTRPHLFGLHNQRPPPLWTQSVEIDERLDAAGRTVRKLDETAAAKALGKLAKTGVRALAIAFMHGFAYPRHEQKLIRIAQAAGFERVVASHQAAQLIKFIPRACTAAADAYLAAALQAFVASLRAQCEDGVRLLFMQSNGALIESRALRAVQTILSGPAGGAIGAQKSAVAAGRRVIGFDMGGTSTDVTPDTAALRLENHLAGVPFFAPMLDIHTIAAGGGSIVRHRDDRLLVGPRSAGAWPGPACYGNGGPLTITDCNVMLGKLQPAHFPAIFGKNRNRPLNTAIVHKKFAALAARHNTAAATLADGFIRVAVENMAAAIRRISTARGIDPGTCLINSFGGASGQHICLVAAAVGASRAMVSRRACVLSAWGIGMAGIGARKTRSTECALSAPQLTAAFKELIRQAVAELPSKPVIQRRVLCRYAGVEATIAVPWRTSVRAMRADFENKHRLLYGYCDADKKIIAAVAEVEATVHTPPPPPTAAAASTLETMAVCAVMFGGRQRRTAFYNWEKLPVRTTINGPAVILDKWNTVVVEPGWRALAADESLLLTRKHRTRTGGRSASAMLEIFNNRFMAVAEQMGETLRRTATSLNIRERLDFSCALFDKRGNLIANAPHIPVHLGSMGDSVRHVLRTAPPGLARGDSFMLNSPYHGGTHLPDITLIKPGRLDGKRGAPDYFIAARGHHADIGGISAGSMPAASRHIDEEGVLINLCAVVKNGRLQERDILKQLTAARYPARNPRQNLADLRAQIAALSAGESEMRRAAAEFGAPLVATYMRRVQNNAARASRRLLQTLGGGTAEAYFDDGAKIAVTVAINRARQTAVFDFTGTSAVHPRNFNAPRAVVHAAVIYCLRVLLGADMPLNDGIMRPIKLIIPAASMLAPRPPAAVAAGNVEVSQHIVDAVFAALGVCAHAQGTCNNFTLGSGGKQYYETVCGGGGAGPGFDGSDAMQVHMTNSRASDPEILENHYPLRLEKFSFRRNSGGGGKYRGGMGAVRHLRFLAAGEATVLSSRRQVAPQGQNGGGDGKCGRNTLRRKNGKLEKLSGCAKVSMAAGDMMMIETPGGGGWGAAGKKNSGGKKAK